MYLEVEQMTREKMLWLPSKGYFHQVEQTCSHTNTKKLGEFFFELAENKYDGSGRQCCQRLFFIWYKSFGCSGGASVRAIEIVEYT